MIKILIQVLDLPRISTSKKRDVSQDKSSFYLCKLKFYSLNSS